MHRLNCCATFFYISTIVLAITSIVTPSWTVGKSGKAGIQNEGLWEYCYSRCTYTTLMNREQCNTNSGKWLDICVSSQSDNMFCDTSQCQQGVIDNYRGTIVTSRILLLIACLFVLICDCMHVVSSRKGIRMKRRCWLPMIISQLAASICFFVSFAIYVSNRKRCAVGMPGLSESQIGYSCFLCLGAGLACSLGLLLTAAPLFGPCRAKKDESKFKFPYDDKTPNPAEGRPVQFSTIAQPPSAPPSNNSSAPDSEPSPSVAQQAPNPPSTPRVYSPIGFLRTPYPFPGNHPVEVPPTQGQSPGQWV
eukprot:NODE_3944_length_1256_cov_62.419241_g3461_i0.p1 GENE.NODE_3944_length_1256_cov_62.419241_g3461_i0~~NODE_3944_length_1256_cov_62.419241_g3461_i0.p1  ORF type:complete len:306 (-),score=53.11 NODE_3944_length_1256_cov_62.419241_g3461_i0:171-1088(-)